MIGLAARRARVNAIEYLRNDINWAHQLLDLVIEDATPEQLHWHPPGTANPLGATYAHSVCSEDAILHQLLLQVPPLFETEWKGRTGISAPQWPSGFDWARELQVELPTARAYAQAVYGAVDDHLASLQDADLDHIVDLSAQGFGEKPVAWILSSLIVSHTNNMTGEAAALKGFQGAKGYPW